MELPNEGWRVGFTVWGETCSNGTCTNYGVTPDSAFLLIVTLLFPMIVWMVAGGGRHSSVGLLGGFGLLRIVVIIGILGLLLLYVVAMTWPEYTLLAVGYGFGTGLVVYGFQPDLRGAELGPMFAVVICSFILIVPLIVLVWFIVTYLQGEYDVVMALPGWNALAAGRWSR